MNALPPSITSSIQDTYSQQDLFLAIQFAVTFGTGIGAAAAALTSYLQQKYGHAAICAAIAAPALYLCPVKSFYSLAQKEWTRMNQVATEYASMVENAPPKDKNNIRVGHVMCGIIGLYLGGQAYKFYQQSHYKTAAACALASAIYFAAPVTIRLYS